MLETSVSDTGIGIKPDDLENIFQAFSQVDLGTNRLTEGAGLGLTICKRLTEMLGGRMAVKSESGEGSVFTLSLPATKKGP